MQIFDEVWRRFRDFFYVANLHGHDWDDLRARYRSLLPHVEHRSDLNYVINEMIAELQVSHAYIGGGDYEIPDRPDAGFPGARFAWDEDAGRFRITRIFEGHNEEPRLPLAARGSRGGHLPRATTCWPSTAWNSAGTRAPTGSSSTRRIGRLRSP